MVRLNAAYEELTDPQRKEAAQTSAQRRRDATVAAAALAAAGRTVQALAAFFSCDDEAPPRGLATESGASSANRNRRETSGRDLFLAACAPGRDGLHEVPTHAQLSQLWLWLGERQMVDSDVCNGWFKACMRAGQTKAAVEAYQLAEREGFEQGSHMRAYIRQVRSYKAAQAARAAGGGGGSG
jgi:pentatricopeptide repeat protein